MSGGLFELTDILFSVYRTTRKTVLDKMGLIDLEQLIQDFLKSANGTISSKQILKSAG